MGTAERAEAIARAAHAGQVDKAGRAYAEHPARVAAAVSGDERLVIVAWLHDVVEDTVVTLADLRAEFGEEIVAAVDALTRRDDENGEEAADDYYARVAANPLARRVKLADLADNSDPVRLAALDAATRERLQEKYAHARAALGCR